MSQKLALLIGNSRYADARLAELRKPRADVAALAIVLREPTIGGFDDVKTLVDASAARVRRVIARFFSRGRSREDLLLLYFSGHGARDDQGQLHLAVRDTEEDLLAATAISAAFISGEMDRGSAKRLVLILDCCYSGAFARGAKGGLGSSVGTANAFEGNGFGRVVLTASDSFEYAWEEDKTVGEAKTSVFTRYLIQGLETGEADQDGDGKIGLDELYDYVSERVVAATSGQTPGLWTYKQRGQIYLALNPNPPDQPEQASAAKVTKPRWHGSPYRGLQAFALEHAAIFFGRRKAVKEIAAALRQQAADGRAFVLVLGMSGGGKSSTVRAGVLPALMRPGTVDGVDLWRHAILRPSDTSGDLFDGLITALLRASALPELTADGSEGRELADVLRRTPQVAPVLIKGGLSQAAGSVATSQRSSEQPVALLVLVVDQMEEIFTLERVSTEERLQFIDILDRLARSGRVWILATLRHDFYPRCMDLPALVALKRGEGQYDLVPPTAAEIGQMIRQPAHAAGLRFEEDPATGECLDEVLREAAASNPAALPLLQFALEELYKRRTSERLLTHEAYRSMGGVEGALAQRAEEVFKTLEPRVQSALPRILRALVSVGVEGEDTVSRKVAPLETLVADPRSKALVDAFVDARLFVTELADDRSAVVSLAHEALLAHWPRLSSWLRENREALRVRARIQAEAALWRQEDKAPAFLLQPGKPLIEAADLLEHRGRELSLEEKAFIRASTAKGQLLTWLKRAVVSSLLILTLVAGGAAYLANEQRKRAATEAETARRTSEFMVDLFAISDPGEAQGESITAREILNRGVERITDELGDQPEIQATLMTTMGKVYTELGLYAEATPLLQDALEKRRQIHGSKHLAVAETLNELFDLLIVKGDYAIAETVSKELLPLRRELLGDDHPDVAQDLADLATLSYIKGDYEKAQALYYEALDLWRESLEKEYLGASSNPTFLTLLLAAKGAYAEAIQLSDVEQERWYNITEALNNLGLLLATKGDYDAAKPLYGQALRLGRELLGEDHPFGVYPMSNLAELAFADGDYDTADGLYREVLALERKVLGPNHPDVAVTLSSLGAVLQAKGQREAAEGMFRQALDLSRSNLGDAHPDVGVAIQNLASLLRDKGDLSGAETLFREAWTLGTKALGEDHPTVALIKANLADLLVAMRHYAAAETLAREALDASREKLPTDHWRIAVVESVLGGCLSGLGRFEEAEQLLAKSLPVIRSNKGDPARETQIALHRVIAHYEAWGKPEATTPLRAIIVEMP